MRMPSCQRLCLLALCAGLTGLAGELAPYAEGGMPVNAEAYKVTKVLSIPWGRDRTSVGREPTRGAVSWTPRYLWVSATGNIYIADEINHQVLCYDRGGRHRSTFPVLYGGYHLFVDDQERVYTLFRKLFHPFAIAVHRDGKLEREIEVTLPRRSPNGDRVFVNSAGHLCLHWMTSWLPLENLSGPQTRTDVMDIPMTGEKWEYTAAFQVGTLGAEHRGCLSRYAPRCYLLDEAGGILRIQDLAGKDLAQLPVRSTIEREVGAAPDIRLAVAGGLQVVGDDRAGDICLLVRNRARAKDKSAFSLVLFSAAGKVRLAADCFPSEIHYGAEVQFYLSSVVVDGEGALYQLCSEAEQGVKVVKWSR